ncbi:MAG: glycosyltransferase family 39 protein, partial [Anaerolineae bacterium]
MAVVSLTFFGLALRLYHLDHVDLRGDEAFDVLYASQSLSEVIRNDLCCQVYPPLFHTALHYWLLVAGNSEFVFRFLFGLVPGVLLMALTYRLAGELFGARVGILAVLLATVNPYLIWWSQDGHFYSALAAVSAAVFWLGLRCLRRNCSLRDLLPYVIATSLGFYIHYFASFAWGAVNLLALVKALHGRLARGAFRRWLGGQAVAVVLFLPWLYFSIPLIRHFDLGWAPPVSLWSLLWRDLRAYSLGVAVWPGQQRLVPGFAMLLLVAVMPLPHPPPLRGEPALNIVKRSRAIRSVPDALLLLLTPLFAFWLVSLWRPMFDEKFTIFALPLYLTLLALGARRLGRWPLAWGLAHLLLLSTSMLASARYYFDATTYKSPAWRQTLAAAHAQAQLGDALIYNFPEPAVLYYNQARLPIYLLPSRDGLDTTAIEEEVASLMQKHGRLWLIPLPQPQWDAEGAVERWLRRHAERLSCQDFRGLRLLLFRTQPALLPLLEPVDARFGDGIRLRGYRLAVEQTDTGQVVVNLTLVWQSAGATATSYTVFTHLVGEDGQIYGQQDNAPVSGSYPTTDWRQDETIVDQYVIAVQADAPAGEYELRLGLYRPDTGERLPAIGADTVGDYARLP